MNPPPLPAQNLSQRLHQYLQDYWGHSRFRPLQEEIIGAVLNGQDTLAVLPTGGGKSICYQLPALYQDGLCLVVSPLIALMKDQVEQLRKKRITAYAITSGLSSYEVKNILTVASESNCKFLYVSPERLESALFLEYLPGLDVQLIAIDEAHCISQWGHDFRPAYRKLIELRKELPAIPCVALTASATPAVQEDIVQQLGFRNPAIFRQRLERPNLSYRVAEPESKINQLQEILGQVPGSGLVYCRSRRQTEKISKLLQLQGIAADHYHAGLLPQDRAAKQEAWLKNQTRVMVCTNAFGMGIDKSDVRYVVHVDVPDCLESYYQEAGRAGRDGQKAYAILLHQEGDRKQLQEQQTLRFPDLKTIQRIHQSIMNYLQLPSESGAGTYFDFDYADFLEKFPHDPVLVQSVIRILEQEGYWTFTEQLFLPSKVQFLIAKNRLTAFEKEHPQWEPLIKSLLRTYEGIIDQLTSIQEKKLATLLGTTADQVQQSLQQLAARGLLNYQPKKEKPQLYFFADRVRSEDLTLNERRYRERKQAYQVRLQAMLTYLQDREHCRSQLIGNYFGDATLQPCGICDNCLRQQKRKGEHRQEIEKRIGSLLSSRSYSYAELLQALPEYPQEAVQQVIAFLQSEEILTLEMPSQQLRLR
ncbi:MAG: ATP-dependent DNA helicase RecQ [Chitinophagaceae bacterium]